MISIEDIKELQEIVKSKGLDKYSIFKALMSINPEAENKRIEYFKDVVGKYFKEIGNNSVQYHYVHPDLKIMRYDDGRKEIIVEEDNYCLRVFNNILSFDIDKNHQIFNTYVGRYDKCIEISKEQFDEEIAKCNILHEDGKEILKAIGTN